MSKRLRSLLGHLASFLLAGGLLYLALRNVDFDQVVESLRTANYLWLVPLAVLTILSHLLRSWRWLILLRELPDHRKVDAPVSLFSAFSALMIGYFANYAAPRVGEFVRSGLLARKERLSMSGVIGTVVLERILDVAVLLILLVFVFFMLLDHTDVLRRLFVEPLAAQWSRVPTYAFVAASAAGLACVAFAVRVWRRSRANTTGGGRLQAIVASFVEGLATLRTRRKGALILSTVLMWACYVVMTHMPFLILGMTGPFQLSLLDSFYLMTLGAVGVAIPVPGGTGSYHYIAIQSLVHLFGVAQSPAATYAVLTHAAQLMLYAALGAYFLASQKATLGDLKRLEEEAAEAAGKAPI